MLECGVNQCRTDAFRLRSTVEHVTALETKARAFRRHTRTARVPDEGQLGWPVRHPDDPVRRTSRRREDRRHRQRWPAFWKVTPGGDIWTASDAGSVSALNTDQTKAPIGAFHFWSVREIPAGHVGMDMQGAGKMVFMASSFVAVQWGDRSRHRRQQLGGLRGPRRGRRDLSRMGDELLGRYHQLPGEAPVGPSKTKRQVLKTAPVRRRTHPNINAGNPGLRPPIPAGKIVARSDS